VQLVEWADGMDRTFLLAQLIREVDDVDEHPHRDDLDSTLAAPIGREATAMDALMTYLKG
jgi:hypothetical protein